MITTSGIPNFAAEEWYSDPRDHRCPHDAWLESAEINELSTDDRNEMRKMAVTIRLLGAYHDGHIVLHYSDVLSYTLFGADAVRGLGDWLSDSFTRMDNGIIRHEIAWSGFGGKQQSRWKIEARDIQYEWIPRNAA